MKNELVIKVVLLKPNGFQRTVGINKWRYSRHLIYINRLFEWKLLISNFQNNRQNWIIPNRFQVYKSSLAFVNMFIFP